MARPANTTNLSIAQLQRALGERQSELDKLGRQRAVLQKKLDVIDREIERVGGSGAGGTARRGAPLGGKRPRNEHSLQDTIDMVLKAGGKPMAVGDIMKGVLDTGYQTGSANFRGIVNQTLIKDKRFGQAERGIYEIKAGGESKKKG